MSFLLTDSEFAAAREQVRAGGFTLVLYRFLGRLIAAAESSRSLAPAPGQSGRWDQDAIEETLQQWLAESLLDGGLQRAFDQCNSPRAFARYLDRSLRNWLIDQARSRSGPRLLARTQQLLRDNPDTFTLVQDAQGPMDRWWGLTTWDHPDLFTGSDSELITAAFALGDLAILRYSGERADPVLSTTDLFRLVQGVLQRAEAAVSLRSLDGVLRGRFAFAYAPTDVALEDAGELVAPKPPSPESEIEAAGRAALGRLTRRQLEVLRLKTGQQTLEVISEALGCSRGTVDNELRRGMTVLRESAPTDDDLAAVLETVLRITSEEVNDDE